ncbi:sigma-70 family RNA polymerase sigma factor [Prolixibacteraceae bacterium Z1-6]|uniref:Sigma-70 family RNA polymerase sigma factor n=1 Tax=Draconibacterium aestuarii TaxID=2998507 RepID=A0A9X3F2M0_9BACT|nr:sigma-70 family RNA polymerase sigma factor [Prolixibacteraceae bacterium Z1-6]
MGGKTKESDILLIKGLNEGKHSSFKELYEKYSPQLYCFSYNLLKSKDAAEDIVQETFIKIWNRKSFIKTTGSFNSLLKTIALNLIRHSYNNLSKEKELKDELLVALTRNSEKFSLDDSYEDLLKKLEELIEKMPDERRFIFCKKKLEGEKAKDIAHELNISVKAVEYHITKAMKYLREEFKSMGISGIVLHFMLLHMGKNVIRNSL